METQTTIETLSAHAKIFFDKGVAIHVTCKPLVKGKPGSWYNGLIKEIANGSYIVLETFPHNTDKLLFLDEIKSIDSYQPIYKNRLWSK